MSLYALACKNTYEQVSTGYRLQPVTTGLKEIKGFKKKKHAMKEAKNLISFYFPSKKNMKKTDSVQNTLNRKA